jgi:3-dehydroquinate synthase
MSGDPFELGSARPLDFGHWAAHKLESLSSNRLRHGEAVAIGIALDTLYSAHTGLLRPAAAEAVLALLERLGFRLWDEALDRVSGDDGRPDVLAGLAEFREHLGGELTITLLRDIGRGVEVNEMDPNAVIQALRTLRHRDGRP